MVGDEDRSRPLLRTTAFVVALLVLAAARTAHWEAYSQGFPDGHVTELERASKILYIVFVAVSVPIGLWSVVAACLVRKRWVRTAWYVGVGFLVGITVVLCVIYVHLSRHLDDGIGG